MDEEESPPKADKKLVCTDEIEGTNEADEPAEEGEQGGEANATEDVNEKPATPSDTSVAMAEEGKSDEAPKTNKERTRTVWMQRKSYGARHLCNDWPISLFKGYVMQGVGRPLRDMALTIGGSSLRPSRHFRSFTRRFQFPHGPPFVQHLNHFVRRHLPHWS